LFENLDAPAQPAAFAPIPEHEVVPAQQAAADDLPPPAYNPRPEPAFTEADSFVAPRAPAPGTPSPEALARLQAAVNRVPKADGQPPQQPQAAVAAAPIDAEKPRFGINSLINRMTGAQAEAGAQQPARAQPQVTALHQEPEQNEDQDKIEIPAFLRRQAN
jgi:cell division protein FtsZ